MKGRKVRLIGPTDAIKILLPAHRQQLQEACATLLTAILKQPQQVRLWRHGKVVELGDFCGEELYLRIIEDDDGQFECKIAFSGPRFLRLPVIDAYESDDGRQMLNFEPPPEPLWQVSETEVKALLTKVGPHKPGAKPTDDWPEKLAIELHKMGRKRVYALYNSRAIMPEIRALAKTKKFWLPKKDEAISQQIRAFLGL